MDDIGSAVEGFAVRRCGPVRGQRAAGEGGTTDIRDRRDLCVGRRRCPVTRRRRAHEQHPDPAFAQDHEVTPHRRLVAQRHKCRPGLEHRQIGGGNIRASVAHHADECALADAELDEVCGQGVGRRIQFTVGEGAARTEHGGPIGRRHGNRRETVENCIARRR